MIARQQIVILMAGYAAQELAGFPDLSRAAESGDQSKADAIMRDIGSARGAPDMSVMNRGNGIRRDFGLRRVAFFVVAGPQ